MHQFLASRTKFILLSSSYGYEAIFANEFSRINVNLTS